MTTESLPQLLAGQRVLVCRPQADAAELAEALTAMGADARSLPCLEIAPLAFDASGRQALIDLDQFAHVIVTSQYAVAPAMAMIEDYWPQLPVKQQWHALGRKTAQLLSDHDVALTLPPGEVTSEQLLQANALQQVQGKRILIIKGKGGRVHLQQALENRSARVTTLPCYERIAPVYDEAALQEMLGSFKPGWAICLSAETVRNLQHYAQKIDYAIEQCPLIVPSERVAQVAKSLGFNLTYVTERLMPIDIIRCMKAAGR